MSKAHRCHLCKHPGGPKRRVTNQKPACRCDCHKRPDPPPAPPPEPKPEKVKHTKPRNAVARKDKE